MTRGKKASYKLQLSRLEKPNSATVYKGTEEHLRGSKLLTADPFETGSEGGPSIVNMNVKKFKPGGQLVLEHDLLRDSVSQKEPILEIPKQLRMTQ